MSYTLEYPAKLDRQTFERLFDEAESYAQPEIDRVGGREELLEGMWKDHNSEQWESRVYKVDDYVVGCGLFKRDVPLDDDRYLFYFETLLGRTREGSKAWWYSEEAVKAEKKFLLDNSMVGTVSPVNVDARPFSVAGERTCKSFDGQQYFSKYSFRTMRETFPELMGDTFQYPENQFQILKIDI